MFYKVFPGFPHLGEEAIRAGYLTGTRLLPAPVEVGEFLGLTGGLRFAHSVYGLDAASVAEVQAYFRSVA